jgi:molybdate transport system substrate-binding protein
MSRTGKARVKLCQRIAAILIVAAMTTSLHAQDKIRKFPPWSGGANNPATAKGYQFQVADVDNVPDLHGNPARANLVLFIGGNQFFVLPSLVEVFLAHHPELRGHIFYETLPPGILRKQMAADNTLTLGNLTLQVKPDVYEAGARVLQEMARQKQVTNVAEYATNTLAIMVSSGNPKHIATLADLGRSEVKLSMPNPQWEGVANQIANSLRRAGGDPLYQAVYVRKVADGTSTLTEIHHRQTPMRIMSGQADAGVTWASEVQFQKNIGNPIEGVDIPAAQNTTATYAAGIVAGAPHPDAARQWLAFLQSAEAQAIYGRFGFGPPPGMAK